MTVNKELLRETLAYIEEHLDEWDQMVWAQPAPTATVENFCLTAFCFAGTAVKLAGGEFIPDPWDVDFLPPDEWEARVVDPSCEDGMAVEVAARLRLGLTGLQAGRLFAPRNTLCDLRRLVDEFCGEVAAVSRG